jgi:hypothetical protein
MALLLWTLICAGSLVPQSGPVLHWKGDDGVAPATAADSSGNGHAGTYLNGATTSPLIPTLQFPNSRSFLFDGTNDLVQDGGFSWPTGGPVTIAFWSFVATAELTSSSVFSIGNQDWPSNRFQAHVPWLDHVLYWDYGDSVDGRIITSYDGYFDKWTHVALVSEGNGGSFKAIYLDGFMVAAGPVSDGTDAPLTGFTLGHWPLSGNFHRGKLDDFRIYDRVLTSTQIQLLAAGHTEPVAPTGLTATSGPGQIQLSWTGVVGATSYAVKRSLVPGGPHSLIANVPGATAYDDSTVTEGVAYFYVVAANGVNESPASTEASAVPTAPLPAAGSVQNIVVKGCGGLGLEGLVLVVLMRRARRRRD